MAKIGLQKGSGKRLKVREKSVKSQGILKWILSGNPGLLHSLLLRTRFNLNEVSFLSVYMIVPEHQTIIHTRSLNKSWRNGNTFILFS